MKDVGDRFGRGELILPFVLQSAEVMKKAVAHRRAVLRTARRHDQRYGRARHRVWRRARYRQEPRAYRSLPTTATPFTTSANKCRSTRFSRRRSRLAPTRSASPRCWCRPANRCRSASRSRRRAGCTFRSSSAARRSIAISAGASRCSTTVRASSSPELFYARDAFEGLELVDVLTGDAARRDDSARARQARGLRTARAARGRRYGDRSSRLRAVESAGRRRAGAAVLGNARARSKTPSICATSGRASTCAASIVFRGVRATVRGPISNGSSREEFEPRLAALPARSAARGAVAAARRLRLLPCRGPRRRRHPLRSASGARGRALYVPATSRRRAS